MHICEDGHHEVCYECRDCPLCQKIKEIDDLMGISADLSDTIAKLNTQINELTQSVAHKYLNEHTDKPVITQG